MKHLKEQFSMQGSSVVLISLHPQHANKILSGQKKLEFRRVWSTKPVSAIVIYSTVPIQRLVAIAYVKQVHHGSATALWRLAKTIGGGLSRRALYDYFRGKKSGCAIEFSEIKRLDPSIDPASLINGFHAPQSFSYLDQDTFQRIEKMSTKTQEKSGKTLFVAGVHAVGKSTLCDEYAKHYGVIHKSASQLIRETKAQAIAADSKVVKDIPGNQQLLIDAVAKIRADGQTLLLDGHFALLGSDHKPQPLPTEVYSDLSIDGIIVLHDKPSSIAARMFKRDGKSMSVSEIAALQAMELARAKEVAKELHLPFEKITSFDQKSFDDMAHYIFNEPI